jgi:UDPglucose 6-dehydrogenase
MEKLGHIVPFYDPAYESKWEDILDTDVVFICVPTPSSSDGSCDVSIVVSTIERLNSSDYEGIVAIKSTVSPKTTESLQKLFSNLQICFVPEFLRERSASIDFIENHDLCVIGTESDKVFEVIKQAHGKYPKEFIKLTPTEAEFVKYFNNVYNATLITFANSMYEVCNSLDVNYTNVKNAAVHREHITDIYLDCNDNFRGFGGVCLPKDTKALDFLAKQNNLDVEFFSTLIKENSKYKTTVFKGMRL